MKLWIAKSLTNYDQLILISGRYEGFDARIKKYIDEQSWQIEAIEEGVKEANSNNFATDKDIKNFMEKWNLSAN